jgi:succinate dehydrogenase/fumarate reductase flavoprotein subunit
VPYTPEMKELLKKVEASRPLRIEQSKRDENFPRLTLEQIDELLKKYHPDYVMEAKREVQFGANKGAMYPNELVDILEAHPWLDPNKVNLDQVDLTTDLLIIGGGGAGSAAAITASDAGVKDILMVTKLRHGDANTMMAEGGIQGADKANDSPLIHYLDVMGGGHFTNDPELVAALVHDAPLVMKWLEDLGVMFDKEADGTMKTLHGGGTSRKRMHSMGDMSGAEIMRTLRDEVRSRPEVNVMEFTAAVELIMTEDGQCAGAVLLNMETEQLQVCLAKTTIIATGGFGRLHIQDFPTTNHYGATADGLILGYHVGIPLRFMESSQFHPTGAIYPEQLLGLLITEKVRGAGAHLLNIDGEQFIYPLETRDVVSSACIRECGDRHKGILTPSGRFGIWLDSPMIEVLQGAGSVKKLLPAKVRQFARHGIDIVKEPMLIYPTLHYQNGGLTIDATAQSPIPNLFIAGEAAGGIHGQNRLMGNSLLDVCVFGRRAGASAARRIPEVKPGKLTLEHVRKYEKMLKDAGITTDRHSPMLLPDYRGKLM